MTLPTTFRKSRENVIATYNYTDLASGTGTIIYKGYSSQVSSDAGAETTSYHLSSNVVCSAPGNTGTTQETKSSANNGTGSYVKYTEWNLDLSPFNLPQTIKGTAYINFAMECFNTDASNANGYFKVNIVHYDGTTETILGTANTSTLNKADGPLVASLPITLTTKHFKKGDILRVNVETWMKWLEGGNNTFMWFAHSPTNIDTTRFTASETSTKFEVHIPYDLKL